MSLVGTYVQSKEDHWYADPIIRSKDWFVCWDDDDPIELVVRKPIDPQTVIKELQDAGWSVHIASKGDSSGSRCFKDDLTDFAEAHALFLTQSHGPPEELLKQSKRLAKQPDGQGVYYFNGVNGQKRRQK